ncbi:2-nitropropane dioxygenase [Endozoicomonas elysicola]|uniref:Nitronate monooxygenase n=2 Tax=Endozoicomonas elysicola TaxID=305900 RepID=A0A081KAA3_9GAMM|nr:nitronate monooxygenase [Endozoicomonas elysicola]KEI71079.1 2-nitropropane dioxygenase [Endozoicomonas elysicola]
MLLHHMLGLDFPIIQAPMAGVQNWELAAAVAEAGGLGSIPCGMLSPEQVLTEIAAFKQHSHKPYNLNFFCHKMPEIDNDKMAAWEQRLAAYYAEMNVSPPNQMGNLRVPFDDATAEILEPHKPPVLSFHFGLPAEHLVRRIKSWGTVIMSSATTLEEGIWLEANGVDIVIAQGVEAGGHRGMFLTTDIASQMGTDALVRALLTTLTVPVIAAGGIASHQGIVTMMDLGTAGVQIGTSYLLCDESKASPVHRDALKSQMASTALTNLFSGRPARGLSNRLMKDLNNISSDAPDFPYASIALGPLRARAESGGMPDFSPLWSGENRSGCREIPAGQLTRSLWSGAD